MPKIIRAFTNLILIILLLFSVIKIYTERSFSLSEKLTNTILSNIETVFEVDANIESTNIQWRGFTPVIYIQNISLRDSEKNMALFIPSSEIELNTLKTLKNQKIIFNQVTLNKTKIDLKHSKKNIIINNKVINKSATDLENHFLPKVILNDSSVNFTNIETMQSALFEIKNLKLTYSQKDINISSIFYHSSSSNPITLRYRGDYENNSLKSKLYLSANSVSIPYSLLPAYFPKIESDNVTMRVWLTLLNDKITRATGNISTDRLNIQLNNSKVNLSSINSDVLYINDNGSETLSLMRTNYIINNKETKNNKLIINRDDKDNIKLFIEKADKEIIKEIYQILELEKLNIDKGLLTSNINNVQFHINNMNNLDYFNLSIENLNMKLKDNYTLEKVKADFHGNLSKAFLRIKDSSLNNHGSVLLNGISGDVSFMSKGKSIYFSSSDIKNHQGHTLSFSGRKVSRFLSLKLSLRSSLENVLPLWNPTKEMNEFEFSGDINSKIFIHGEKLFSSNHITNIYFNKSDDIYISSPSLNLFTSSNLIFSNDFKLSVNDNIFNSKILTNNNKESNKLIISSLGTVDADILTKSFNIDNIIKGKTKIKSMITYNHTKNELSSFVTSDLKGLNINLIEPFNKQKEQKSNFSLRYQHSPKPDYPVTLTFDQHTFKIKKDKKYITANIQSPLARGFFKYPININNNRSIIGSFEYIDTKYMSSTGLGKSFPALNIKSKHVKTADVVLDNVHLILNPRKDFISIDKLSFKNMNLEMNSSGKWFRSNEEITEISADIKSENFGQALAGLGYPKTLKGGTLSAKLVGRWSGSLEDFSFSATDGDLDFKIVNGQINELDKGTQALGQVLGLFSISSIPKRLSLDFSDFFSRGLKFDDLNSKVTLNNGIADTKKMVIIGSFGEMRLSGKSDLVKQTHDQTLVFIPDLSSTSLVTGAVIGGPIGAAASIFYDRLLKEFGLDTNKLAGIEYSIKGPWEKPEIKVTQSFKPILN
ncbi:MAG: AsmA-like C-terminal region-containing protein [Gammaproteobacteria bacterium]